MKRVAIAHSSDFDTPKRATVRQVKVMPISITGFRPTISLMRPQKKELKNCPTMKDEAIQPA